MKEYKIALVGALGHAHYVLQSSAMARCKVVGMAPGPGQDAAEVSALQRRAQLHSDWPLFANYTAMLQQTQPDIVVVNTVFADNATVACNALQQGCHVFCEKPLATEPADLEKLLAAATNSGKHLVGMFGLRYTAPFLTLQKAVAAGAIGEICTLNAQKSYKMGNRHPLYSHRHTYGGIIPWVAIHAIDWITALVGQCVCGVQAVHTHNHNGGNGDMESGCCCTLCLANGGIATINADVLRPEGAPTHGDDRLRVVGSQGVLEMQEDKVTLCDANSQRELSLCPAGDCFADFIAKIEAKDTSLMAASFYSTWVALTARQAADHPEGLQDIIWESMQKHFAGK